MEVWIADDYNLKNLRRAEAHEMGTRQSVIVEEKDKNPAMYHHALEHNGEWVYVPTR